MDKLHPHDTVNNLVDQIDKYNESRSQGTSYTVGHLQGILKDLANSHPEVHKHLQKELGNYQRLNGSK